MAENYMLEQDNKAGRAGRREHAETMLWAVDFMTEEDRALVRTVYEAGARVSDLTVLMKVPKNYLYGRLNRLEKRLAMPGIRLLLAARDDIAPESADILFQYFIGGVGIPELAEQNHTNVAWVRKKINRYREWMETKSDSKVKVSTRRGRGTKKRQAKQK